MASSAAAIEVVIFSVADIALALRTELEGWDKEQFGQVRMNGRLRSGTRQRTSGAGWWVLWKL
jgi:hypothetical protein